MKGPSYLKGIALALLLATIAGVCFEAFSSVLPSATLARTLVVICAGVYVGFLLRGTVHSAGRLATLVLWLTCAGMAWIFAPTFMVFVASQTALIWLVRTLYYHRSAFGALADLFLSSFAIVFAVATINHTDSFFLTVWVYFLVHSLFVFLPSTSKRNESAVSSATHNFERASQCAEQAIRKLSVQ